MSTTPYPSGQAVRLPATVTTVDGSADDPTTLGLTVRLPDGTTASYAIGDLVRASMGVYYLDYVPPQSGHYAYRYVSTEPAAALEGQFDVLPSLVFDDGTASYSWPGAYLTVPEFKAAPHGANTLDLVNSGTASEQDYELANVLLRASRWADDYCQVPLGAHMVLSEHQSVRIQPDGVVVFAPRQVSGKVPLVSVTRFAYGAGPSNLTTLTPSSTWVQDGTARIELSGSGLSWSGALQFGVPPRGARVYAEADYVAGFPCTTLTAATGAGATSLPVRDATGIVAGQALRVHDPGREEQVTVSASWVAATGPANVTVAATVNAHLAGAGVSSMPMDVRMAVAQVAVQLIRQPTDTASTTSGKKAAVTDQSAPMGAVVAVLDKYRREGPD